jgi:hypothetical protein
MVDWNAFFDVEPRFRAWDETSWNLGEDMLLLTNAHRGVSLALDWLPAHRPRGRFVLSAVRIIRYDAGETGGDWDHPLRQMTTRSKRKAVETLERWLAWYSEHALPAAQRRPRGTR